jgi:hypothetical protein
MATFVKNTAVGYKISAARGSPSEVEDRKKTNLIDTDSVELPNLIFFSQAGALRTHKCVTV